MRRMEGSVWWVDRMMRWTMATLRLRWRDKALFSAKGKDMRIGVCGIPAAIR